MIVVVAVVIWCKKSQQPTTTMMIKNNNHADQHCSEDAEDGPEDAKDADADED